ncbi:hypothetical protein K0M31_014077, partial [Melipona bicolor]
KNDQRMVSCQIEEQFRNQSEPIPLEQVKQNKFIRERHVTRRKIDRNETMFTSNAQETKKERAGVLRVIQPVVKPIVRSDWNSKFRCAIQ